MIQIDTWTNCYDLNWKNLITPAAFSHPAKFSHGLIKRIYEHALAEGMIQPGGVVLDPFGGVGLGALYAMQNGLHWVGVELESKFVELGRENINLWNDRYAAHFPNWGSAQIIQGDSRRLAEVVAGAGVVVGSPPYVGGGHHNDQTGAWGGAVGTGQPTGKDKSIAGYGQGNGQMGQMKEGDIQAVISSPPFAGNSGGRGDASRNGPSTRSGGPIDPGLFDRHSGGMKGGTGSDPANLDHLPMGTPPMAIVSSPPYAESLRGDNKPDYDRGKIEAAKASGTTAQRSTWGVTNSVGVLTGKGYGSADGNLGNLPPGEISAVIASPPFADSVGSDDPDKRGGLFRDEKRRNDTNLTGTYGETPGQLGGMKAGEHSFTIFLASKENNGIMSPKENELCQDVKIAESKLPDVADGAGPAPINTLANHLREEKSTMDLGLNSQRQSSMSQCQTIGENSILTGAAAMIDGEDTHGGDSAVQPLNEMDINAQDAAQPNNYKSTTKKGKKKQAESGITNSTTLKLSAPAAISNTTGPNGTTQSVQSAENEPEQRLLSSIAPPNAKENPAAGHQKGLTENSTKPINALSAEKNLSGKPEDISTAPQSAQVQPEQKSKANTNEDPNTFWASARLIVEQCALLLPPNGVAIWVVKSYVKGGKIVDFPGQWQQLCEACGFETVHIHRAMLVKEHAAQKFMLGGIWMTNKVSRKSFFRRLAEKKGSPPIDYETILCMRKAA